VNSNGGGITVTNCGTNAFQVYNYGVFPFTIDKNGNTLMNNLTATGTSTLQSVSCTGATDTGTLSVTGNLSCSTLGSTGAVTVGGNLSVSGYSGIGIFAYLYPTGLYTTGTSNALQWWGMLSYGPQAISHTNNSSLFQVSAAGMYLITVNITFDSSGYSGSGLTIYHFNTALTTRHTLIKSSCHKTINFQPIKIYTALV
jgi:hypothetical protein